jgi:peptide/nickel transport system substrate-binding protein
VVNPGSANGGTIVYDTSAPIDSADPGNTYDISNWDFLRLYDRTMLSYTQKPGPAGLALEGDLATGLGTHNAEMTVWTYHIHSPV